MVKEGDEDNDGDNDNIKDTDKDKNTDIVTYLGDVAAPPAWSMGDHIWLHGLNTASLNGTGGVISQLHAGRDRFGAQVHSGKTVATKIHNLIKVITSSFPSRTSSPCSSASSPSKT
ncbi:unnamed protein product [Prorocentrum cordatum]|uniref:Uncharacterized protein n=1 Tax=Prorocentrum cordatum TaxID=2364126 RepID=A0ABN9TS83_9DINO|nr:unnamed protein product [Polarella glacialis]